MNINEAIGLAMRRAMKRKKVTVRVLSGRSGYSSGTVFNVLTGQHSPTANTLYDMCSVLEVGLDEIMLDAMRQIKKLDF